MKVYPEEIAGSNDPAKLVSKPRERDEAVPHSAHSRRRGRRGWAAAFPSAVVRAIGFCSLSRQLAAEAASPEATALAVLPEKSIAVLPLENLIEVKQNAFLVDGVQD